MVSVKDFIHFFFNSHIESNTLKKRPITRTLIIVIKETDVETGENGMQKWLNVICNESMVIHTPRET